MDTTTTTTEKPGGIFNERLATPTVHRLGDDGISSPKKKEKGRFKKKKPSCQSRKGVYLSTVKRIRFVCGCKALLWQGSTTGPSLPIRLPMKHWSQKQGEKTKWGYTWLCGGRRQHTQRGGGRGSNSNGINSSSVGTRNRRMQGRRYVSACYLSRLSVHFLSIQLAIFSLSLPMIRWSLSNFCFPIYNVAAFSFFFYSACDVVVVEQPRRKLIVVGNKSSSPETFVSFSFFFSLSLLTQFQPDSGSLSLCTQRTQRSRVWAVYTQGCIYRPCYDSSTIPRLVIWLESSSGTT